MMNIFIILALIGLIAAVINDIRKREVADWISYSLLAVLLASSAFYSIINLSYSYFVHAVFYSVVLFAAGSTLYFLKLIGGGDVKLIAALGPVFLFINIFNFLIILLIISGIYGIIYSLILGVIYWKPLIKKLRFNFIPLIFVIMLAAGITLNQTILIFLSIIVISPYIIIFVSAVEKVALIKEYSPEKLTEGDWLVKDLKINHSVIIKAKAEGLTKEEIKLIKIAKMKVTIKEGIPYVPVFLISFVLANFIDTVAMIKGVI